MSEFRRRKAHERLRDARAALARGDHEAAADAFAAGLRLDPSDRAGWELWAHVLEQQGKMIEAGRVLVEALEHHGDDPTLQLSLAHAHIETGQFAGAKTVLDQLRARWPEQRPPLAYLARMLRDIRAYTSLRALLEQALAGPFAGDAELAGLLDACLTWQGERSEPAPVLASMRELLLMEHGAVLLGTGHDDGLTIPWYSTYLCTNYDVVATCARLLGFSAYFDWRWSAVAAIDPAAQVLALLLADALEVDRIELPPAEAEAEAEAYPDPETTLALASFVAPGWSQGGHGPWARRCAAAGNMFAFGALNYAAHPEPLPPLLGLAAGERVCLPWWRLGEARIGFARFGLIDDLPPEIDARSPEDIADDYRRALAEFEPGPNFVAQLRHVLEHRHQLQPGLRRRSDFARILPRVEPRAGPSRELPDALARGDMAEFLRALGPLEREPERIGAPELRMLEARFVDAPGVRSRLSDLLYRVAPARFSTLLHELVARPADEVPWPERDGLLHLYGCNPWTGAGGDPSPASAQLQRWLELGAMTNRSEIVQSKYGLHHLAEAEDFARIFAQLLADAPAIALGTIRWLHDNPHLHGPHAPSLLPLLDHDHADVVFETLQCTRVAKLPLSATQLEPILLGHRHPHPRMISAAVEHLELWPIAEAHPRLAELLRADEPTIVWAAARSLLRGGESLDERVAGAELVAARILELDADTREAGGGPIRQLLRALASADDYALFEPLLRASESASIMKIVAAALTPALLELDDPHLVVHLRRFRDAFGLDPPFGYASFLVRHGDPELDRDAVFGAQGATEPRAGYEAKAALARWGDADARAELERALDYAPPAREAAFEAWLCVLHEPDYPRLDAARTDDDPELVARVWTVLCANIGGAHPAPRGWIEGLSAYLRESPAREAAWASSIEQQLRAQITSKFVVGAQSASFAVLAELLPKHFDNLVERSLGGTPERLSVDLLEWLGEHRNDAARAWAQRLVSSPHWGVRQSARRLLC
ncbi:Beta-barrel assembly-enhancing protease [Enhygromyxa salina]|uniref:Beta-barrel assembly-enhancing protease n=1 Tax=Enhygromyxa salina TaxID=215803 RepID=A0A2S9XH22_9BACT|nr:tetratricopeptide repeat protein [Enhygromyxa salina]PRP92163.1 Beta-barrel assembly-enhancing protease [Enhygromyxa salina]